MSVDGRSFPAAAQAKLVRNALAAGRPARLAMRGGSMLPLLREPMVLELRAFRGTLRAGEIAVFRAGERLVAHRVVGVNGDVARTCGDAQPHRPETVDCAEIVGLVARVWSAGDAGARRVDGFWFGLRGALYARIRPLRAFLYGALPWTRPRTFTALYCALAAIVRRQAWIARIVDTEDMVDVADVARRHGCEAILHEAIARSNAAAAVDLRALLQRGRWSARLRTGKLREQLVSVVKCLNARGMEPVLLKGAARLWLNRPQSELHDSIDLDLLLPSDDLEAARSALLEAGYSDERYRRNFWYYRTIHHHLAPLHVPGGVSVELHRALAAAGTLSLSTDFDTMQRYLAGANGADGNVRVFDARGTSIHLAVHGFVRPKLRDVFLLAQQLRAMSSRDRTEFRSFLESDRHERVRLSATAYLAARMAGVEWPSTPQVRRFADWALLREELPRPLRARPECADAWMSAAGQPLRAAVEAAFRSPYVASQRRYLRALARLAAGIATLVYLQFAQQSEYLELLQNPDRVMGDDGTIDVHSGSESVDDPREVVRAVT